MIEISFYPSFADKGRAVELIDVLKAIKDGAFKNDVETLRSLKGTGYNDCKKRLPHFTPSGVFGAARKKEHLISYSQAVVLDIDHIGPEKAKKLRDGMFLFGHCLAAFLSPGGEGLKILVLTDSTLETHGSVFNQVADFYERALGCIIDRSGKDITRTCFVSHDPNLWLNEDAVRFRTVETRLIASEHLVSESVPLTAINDGYPVISKDIDDESLFIKMVDFTGVVDQYVVGNRNNFIFKLACNLNKAGMGKAIAERLLKANYADLSSEIAQVVHSAYKHTEEHGLYGLAEVGPADPLSVTVGSNPSSSSYPVG